MAGQTESRLQWVVRGALCVPLLLWLAYYIGTPAFTRWLWSEQGLLEISHVVIPLIAMGLGLATLAAKGRIAAIRQAKLGWLAAAICGLAVLCGLIAGEEASWGQHFVGWTTPETWSEMNDQHETNLHNIGSWADQKPRAIVELSVVLFGILWPIWNWCGIARVPKSWQLVLPPLMVFPVAFFAEAVRFLERGPRLVGIPRLAAFPRPSELQELYFYLFFAICMVAWRQRLLSQLGNAEEQASSSEHDADAAIPQKLAA